MKTSELSGAALDWAVANCEGLLAFGYRTDGERFVIEDSDGNAEGFMPSTDWAQGGEIFERECISIENKTGTGVWVATRIEGSAVSEAHGGTPLISAMRCYVASKLGDEVEIPNKLKGQQAMNWNHRVVNCPSENGGDDLYTFKEVYYDDHEGKPYAYSNPFMCGDGVDELKELLQRLEKALGEPVLHENDFGGDK